MRPYVGGQGAFHGERPIAVRTGVRSLAGVHSHVANQIARFFELFRAIIALMPLDPIDLF